MGTRVLLVEPNRIVREGIRAELARNGAEIVAEAATGAEAIAAAGRASARCRRAGLQASGRVRRRDLRALAERLPSTPIIVLSEPADEASVVAAVESGARAYLLKDADDLDLGGAIERVLAGESVIDPRAAAALIDSRRGAGDPKLSRQELKVLRLVAEGLTNPEIGARLYLSRHTVKEYLSHAMRKLEVSEPHRGGAQGDRARPDRGSGAAGSRRTRRSPGPWSTTSRGSGRAAPTSRSPR